MQLYLNAAWPVMWLLLGSRRIGLKIHLVTRITFNPICNVNAAARDPCAYLKGSPFGSGASEAAAASSLKPAMWADKKETTVSAALRVRSAVLFAMSANAQLDCNNKLPVTTLMHAVFVQDRKK